MRRFKYPQLRVKIKSLAEEARIIRAEERRWVVDGRKDNATWHSLNHHRRHDVRDEARASLLAYAYLRGVPYSVVENKTRDRLSPGFNSVYYRVADIAQKFGPSPPPGINAWRDWFREDVKRWIKGETND